MSSEPTPYVSQNPGDLITAEAWNDVQKRIKEDIGRRIGEAIGKIIVVPNAENAYKLQNKTAEELAQEIVRRALQEIPKRTGYQKLFKRLKGQEEKAIEHKLETCPLVDVYALDAFPTVCSEDEQKTKETTTLFYLYHTSEKKIRYAPSGGAAETVTIEETDHTPFRIAFKDLLALYHVTYTEDSTLDDLETEFWKAFFADPNDQFDDDQYCHSPWWDRCCGDRRTVAELKKRGDWDDLWLKMAPRKTINYTQSGTTPPTVVPDKTQVVHFDLNTVGVKYLAASGELPVMLLLKV